MARKTSKGKSIDKGTSKNSVRLNESEWKDSSYRRIEIKNQAKLGKYIHNMRNKSNLDKELKSSLLNRTKVKPMCSSFMKSIPLKALCKSKKLLHESRIDTKCSL